MKHHRLTTIILLLLVALAPSGARAYDEFESDALGMIILAPYSNNGYWWDHTQLTVHIKAGGNVDQRSVDAMYEAVAIWNAAIANRHGDLIQMTVVTGDPVAAAQADIVVNLHAQGGSLFGIAHCQSGQKCQVQAWDHERANANARTAIDLSYEELVSLAVHEMGHALGLGHADPIYPSLDVMGYGNDSALFAPAVISRCNMDAFDVVWAWAINGEEPYPPTPDYISC